MAALSEETQAIIKRLTDEGLLLRNTGTNSIRSIKTDLSKFDSLFQTISDNTVEQTDILRQSLIANTDLAEINAERARRNDALADLSQSERDEMKQKELDAEKMRIDNDLNDQIERRDAGKESKGLFGTIKSGIGSLFSVKSLAIGAAAFTLLPIAYGFFDQITGGKLTEIKNDIMEMDFSLIKGKIVKFGLAMAAISGVALAIKGLGVVSALTKFVSAIGGIGNVPVPGASAPGRGLGLGARAGFGIAGALMFAYGDQIKDTIRKEALGMTPDEIKNTKFDALDLAGGVVTGATLGMMFGPTGAIAGAALGGAYALGSGIVDIITDNMDKANADPDQVPSEVKRISEMYRAFQSNMLGVMKVNAGEALNRVTEIRDDLQEDLNEDLAEIQQMKNSMSGADDRTRNAIAEKIKEREADIQNQQKIIANVNKSVEKYTNANELQKALDSSDVPLEMAHNYKAKTAAQVAKAAEGNNSGGTTVVNAPVTTYNTVGGSTNNTSSSQAIMTQMGHSGADGLPV